MVQPTIPLFYVLWRGWRSKRGKYCFTPLKSREPNCSCALHGLVACHAWCQRKNELSYPLGSRQIASVSCVMASFLCGDRPCFLYEVMPSWFCSDRPCFFYASVAIQCTPLCSLWWQPWTCGECKPSSWPPYFLAVRTSLPSSLRMTRHLSSSLTTSWLWRTVRPSRMTFREEMKRWQVCIARRLKPEHPHQIIVDLVLL